MQRDSLKTSVALGTFNGATYLGAQLESLGAQIVTPLELVVQDDGSSDSTLDILHEFAVRAPFPVHIFRSEYRLGFAENFLTLADRCAGDLIAFCDQDDVWHPEKIAECTRVFRERPEVLCVVHTSDVVDEALEPLGIMFPDIPTNAVISPHERYRWFDVLGMGLVFDASLLELFDWRTRPPTHGLEPWAAPHDQWVHFVASSAAPVAYVSKSLALYRQHSANFVGGVPPTRKRSEMLRSTLWENAFDQARRAEVCGQYADYLAAHVRGISDPSRASAVAEAAASWRQLERAMRRRNSMYNAPFWLRGRVMASLLREHAYRPMREGGLGRRALIRDLRQLFIPQAEALPRDETDAPGLTAGSVGTPQPPRGQPGRNPR